MDNGGGNDSDDDDDDDVDDDVDDDNGLLIKTILIQVRKMHLGTVL
jgi:hypothetical protein